MIIVGGARGFVVCGTEAKTSPSIGGEVKCCNFQAWSMVLQASRGFFPKLLNVMPQWSDEGNRSGSRPRGHESTGAEV